MTSTYCNGICRYDRGQVWYIDDKGQGAIGTEIQKSRPWLILSRAEKNMQRVTCAPITHNLSGNQFFIDPSTSIKYIYELDESTILLDQMTTKDISRFGLGASRYMYSLPEQLMRQVDDAILDRVGIVTPEQLMISHINYAIDRLIASKQFKSAESYITTDQIDELIRQKMEESGYIKKEDARNTYYVPAEAFNRDIDKDHIDPVEDAGEEDTDPTKKPSDDIPRTKTGRIKWNEELAKKVILDYDSYGSQYIANVYGMNLASIPATVNRLSAKYNIKRCK